MCELRSIIEKLSSRKILQYLRITADCTLCYFLFRRLTSHACERSLGSHASALINELNERHIILTAYTGIIFTEGRSLVNDTGTVFSCNVRITYYIMSSLVLLSCHICRTLIKGLVVNTYEICSLIGLKNLISLLTFLCKR